MCCQPAATVKAVAIPETVTGLRLSAVVPSPSWPKMLLPQHLTPPPERTAQVVQ